jgi:hypothetical protein
MGGAEIDPTESLMPLLNYSRSGLLIRLHALVVYNLDESICTYVQPQHGVRQAAWCDGMVLPGFGY